MKSRVLAAASIVAALACNREPVTKAAARETEPPTPSIGTQPTLTTQASPATQPSPAAAVPAPAEAELDGVWLAVDAGGNLVVGTGIPAVSLDGKRYVYTVEDHDGVELRIADVATERVVQVPKLYVDHELDRAAVGHANALLAKTRWRSMHRVRPDCGADGCYPGAPGPFAFAVDTHALVGTLVWSEPTLTFTPRAGGKPLIKEFPRWAPRYRGGEHGNPIDCSHAVALDSAMVADDAPVVLLATAYMFDHQCEGVTDTVHAVTLR